MTDPSRGVLDTNAVVLLDRIDAAQLPSQPVITAITLAELTVGPLVAADEVERRTRQSRLQETEAAFDPLPFDAAAARVFGRIAAELRHDGRRVQARAFDALIAATAVANGLPVYTCNPRDFQGIHELELIAIPHPGGSDG